MAVCGVHSGTEKLVINRVFKGFLHINIQRNGGGTLSSSVSQIGNKGEVVLLKINNFLFT